MTTDPAHGGRWLVTQPRGDDLDGRQSLVLPP
jgi:hypothetical protein